MVKRKATSPVAVVEAAYDLESDDHAWLGNVTRALGPLIDDGHGITAYLYDVSSMPGRWSCKQSIGMSREHEASEEALFDDKAVVAGHRYVTEPVGGAVAAARQLGFNLLADPRYVESWRYRGIADCVAYRTIEPGYRGVAFISGLGAEWRRDRRLTRLWTRLSAHIAAARRLRAAGVSEGDAVLKPDGRVDHVATDPGRSVREILRAAVLRQEAARSTRDPVAAVEAWTAMANGRWTLVDRFERGGRRYLVAHRNEIPVANPQALTPRERVIARLVSLGKSNKLIGYELGLSESTISTHLSAIMSKLGVASRVALIALLHGVS